ncbi:hypothetical protein GPEL0_01r5002 [Geoanaerobacter pelophilus]|uniref:Uncharacterized protein n=1 Tax=Geoanaerobacter pelophilus TaxID=60036 RepID=A0ABQ0MND7_9BACT|nr:hypothetical protein GPEL0_01r5002 [Geoanaerobacter pelophilus]
MAVSGFSRRACVASANFIQQQEKNAANPAQTPASYCICVL